ncbi:polysaccharide deacetylase family protein [Paenibacillus sp. MZ04-78.2]|uniref:polysaccharide deacetylase family protein n=1 Tax=Paenibacillus sp. MZ04-78.2 TaxID=2962034 RepID=UPI0020B6E435|nr:polysaccharide deacetylase family protein [Paenibacillus sp. MZ04-78.2]MCP3773119.1 polysaccharide deacetylase family protein [Paenibacillus sp. MZ04-78.2]
MFRWLVKVLLAGCVAIGVIAGSVYQWGSYPYADQVAVLAYHHLDDTDKSNVTITPELFRKQVSFLKEKGYRFLTLSEFRDFMNGKDVPRQSVLITFDDGYESFYTQAYPVLKELGIPAVNFVVTKDLAEPKTPILTTLSEEQIRQMTSETDFIDFQCHSHDLHQKVDGNPLLTTLLPTEGRIETAAEYGGRILKDTRACVSRLHALHSQAVDMYAYPYGMYDRQASDLVGQAGIRYAFTVKSGMVTRKDDVMQIPRINAGNPSITPEKLHRTIMRRAVKAHFSG